MSIKVMNLVWANADCSGSELLILLAMADFADDDGRNIYPSMPTLAHKARLSESQARRIVKRLAARGIIEILEPGGWNGKRNLSNHYRIILNAIGGGSNMTPPRELERGSNMTPPPSRRRAHRGRVDDTTVVSPARPDPSYNRAKKRSSKQRASSSEERPYNPYRPPEYDDIILG